MLRNKGQILHGNCKKFYLTIYRYLRDKIPCRQCGCILKIEYSRLTSSKQHKIFGRMAWFGNSEIP